MTRIYIVERWGRWEVKKVAAFTSRKAANQHATWLSTRRNAAPHTVCSVKILGGQEK